MATLNREHPNSSYDPEELVLKDSPDFGRLQRIFHWHCVSGSRPR
jgi:hypothetical protein